MSIFFLLSSIALGSLEIAAQTNAGYGKNNPYSPSPGGRTVAKTQSAREPIVKTDPNAAAFIMQAAASGPTDDSSKNTVTKYIGNAADPRVTLPTEIYKVGVGDVLLVNLKNAAQGSGYHTVRQDGTIDFALAGEHFIVADRTIDDIARDLTSRITLYAAPQVEVKVREYGSHKVTVSGLVNDPGEKCLQREAIPLYVIKAQAVVSPKAARAIITRAPLLQAETYDLHDANTDNVLIYPGNTVEFASDAASLSSAGVFFISGEVVSAGQKDLISGMTLYQAIAASGGAKGDPKKAVIRRKNGTGIFIVFSHELRSIRDGKAADPPLVSGDVVEIRN